MKIDAYVLFLEHPSRFELKIDYGWDVRYSGSYLKVVALDEMDDEQVLRLALDNISDLLERLEVAGATINVHLDRPLHKGDIDKANESIDRLRALLASPDDLQFNGGSMI